MADTAPAQPTTPSTVSSDALPTAQINGVAWDQVIVGNTVYVGGNFSTARPAGAASGTNTVPRTHLLAYNLTTGALLPWAPTVNGQVRSIAASPDGSRLYVGGDFTTINGATKNRIAAFDTASGNLVTAFQASANAPVYAVVATNSVVYFGGQFSQARSVARMGAAAATTSTGTTTAWAPQIQNGRVFDMAISPDESKIAIGGSFTSLNGSSNPGYGLAGVDASLGALLPWGVNSQVRNATKDAAIYSLASDGDSFYGTGYHFNGGGNLEGTFRADWATGNLTWVADCHGDTYSVAPAGDTIYTASHAHYCGNVDGPPQTEPWSFNRALAFSKGAVGVNKTDPYGYPDWTGTAKPELLTWFPSLNQGSFTGQFQGPWNVAANSQYAVYAGEFTQVNGVGQQGLVRFATRSIAPNLDGPRLTGNNFAPTLDSPASGAVRVSWAANWDRDNENLTYHVIRDGRSGSPVWVGDRASTFWDRPTMTFIDRGLTPGQTYSYRLRAIDPLGNTVFGSTVSVTASNSGSISDYAASVVADQPTSYWRLGDGAGSTVAADSAGSDTARVNGGVGFGATGAIGGDSTTAASFSGDASGLVASSSRVWRDDTFSVEAWFKTTSTSGGKIVGFGSDNVGNSSSYDRHVFMNGGGKVIFGVYPGTSRTIASSKSFNDGEWHHVVASLGANGMTLFVDGRRVGSDANTTRGQQYWGYWRIGGDNSWDGNPYFQGSIDEVAVYPKPLTQERIVEHYRASGRAGTAPDVPADAYGAAVYAADPLLYWRLGEVTGTTATDSGQEENTGRYSGSYTGGGASGVKGTSNPSTKFTAGVVASIPAYTNPSTYSTEIWFSTTTSRGGKLTGFGAAQSGFSSSYDRHVYMQDDGKLVFGTWTGRTNTITTDRSYNDGGWHHVVATQSSSGMRLYLDGVLVGTNPETGAEGYTGYWRAGGDITWGSSDAYFDGSLDEFAVYSSSLPASTVASHYALGAPDVPNSPPSASFVTSVTDLSVSVDATASSDPDGDVASYAWDFGDGTTGTGATTTHEYATGGTKTITLTVTDDDGATDVTTRFVEVVRPDAPPVAEFTSSTAALTVSLDASASNDPDGEVASYAWSFGDGTTGTGVTTEHTYATSGTRTVTLTVTDDDGLTSTRQAQVTVAPLNSAPTASFAISATNLRANVDATASTDDGTISSYSWDFGDGGRGSGATAVHDYAGAGTFTVKLTVTDGGGLSNSTTREVTVTATPASGEFARDTFTRANASGLGTADLGGSWTSAGANYAVNNGSAALTHTAGSTRRATLGSTSSSDSDIRVAVTLDKAATGSGVYAGVVGRQIGTEYYQARVRFNAGGSIGLQTLRGPSTVIANANVAGITVSPGGTLQLRVQVTGVSPTTIRAKVWQTGSTEPSAWSVSSSDSTPSLQNAGAIGLESYLSASVNNAPVVVRFDDLSASSTTTAPPAPNSPPVAAFTSSSAGLSASFSGSSSQDPDGTVIGWAWAFGDGTSGVGSSASHVYAAAGTYTVVLTVTDDRGASASSSRPITVAQPAQPVGGQLAADSFGRDSASGWGSADVGGAWTSGSNAFYRVGEGVGQFSHTAGSTRRATLASVSDSSVSVSVALSSDSIATTGDVYAGIIGRQVGSSTYQARVRISSTGAVSLQLLGNGGAVLVNTPVSGLTYTAGQRLNLTMQTTGSSPTTVRAKVWAVGQQEPGWIATAVDGAPSLQSAGLVGLEGYVSASAPNTPIVVRYDDFVVTHLD